MNLTNWDKRFIGLASHISTWSKDNSTKIGCVAVNNDHDLLSIGFNGIARGLDDSLPERQERPLKYSFYEHAERNLVYNAARIGISLKGSTVYLQWFPCDDCSRALIQSGIKRIVCQEFKQDSERGAKWTKEWEEKCKVSKEMLIESGVKIDYY